MTAMFKIVEDDCPPLPTDISDVSNAGDLPKKKKNLFINAKIIIGFTQLFKALL